MVDPWLDKTLNPHSSFILQREREEPSCLSEKDLNKVKAVIITAPFVDHLHLPSLKKLNKDRLSITSKILKKDKDFSAKREEILEMIWNMEEEIMGKEN